MILLQVVYYRGQWGKFTLTAITKLDKDLYNLADEEHHLENPLDILILIRNFVSHYQIRQMLTLSNWKPSTVCSMFGFLQILQSKYMHSCGIRHDDIKPDNIMVQKWRSYLIDFNMSSRMAKDNHGYNLVFASRRLHKNKRRFAIDDFESFLFSMLYILKVPLDIFLTRSIFDRIFANRFYKNSKQKTNKILVSW